MTATGFDARAARYEELRPVDDNWWEVYAILVRLGELRGARVLEVGCGTGRLAQAIEQREHARVWAVDASQGMVDRAKAIGVAARLGRAEALPFKEGWFDAVVMRMSLHLLDRPRALAQAARVLAPGGRLAIATEDPESFGDVWFARFFPSVPAIDRQRRTTTREKALDVIRSRAFSTFDLIPPDEYAAGLARAEAELPEQLEYSFDWLLAAATR
jgi:ubiquinone/menaquinone biosynthesis C-methylase UbiE